MQTSLFMSRAKEEREGKSFGEAVKLHTVGMVQCVLLLTQTLPRFNW
jgi:hypothetical protein